MNDRSNRQTNVRRLDPPADRLATAEQRHLPDVVIIGAQRGGTTSMYRYLTEHPEVGAASRKEVHFFDSRFEKGLDWYRAHFPRHDESRLVAVASPTYLFAPGVPARIQPVLPTARYIALLRNPVHRAYSHYQHMVRRGSEPLSFADAIAAEDERLTGTGDPLSPAWRRFSYLRRGHYAEQLERWLAVIPREQLLVLQSEELFADPMAVLRQTQSWLGLAPWPLARRTAHQTGDYAAMDDAIRARLTDYFAPHNRRLYDLLGRDFGWDGG